MSGSEVRVWLIGSEHLCDGLHDLVDHVVQPVEVETAIRFGGNEGNRNLIHAGLFSDLISLLGLGRSRI